MSSLKGPADLIDERLKWPEVFGIIGVAVPTGRYQSGRGGRLPCPIHQSSNSTSMAYGEGKPAHCFVCNKSWTKLGMAAAVLGISKKDALPLLAEAAGVELGKITSKEVKEAIQAREDEKDDLEDAKDIYRHKFEAHKRKKANVQAEIDRCGKAVNKAGLRTIDGHKVWEKLSRLYRKMDDLNRTDAELEEEWEQLLEKY